MQQSQRCLLERAALSLKAHWKGHKQHPGGQSISGETPAQSCESSSCLMWHLSWWITKMNGMCADISTQFSIGNCWCNTSHQTLKRIVNSGYLKFWIQRKQLCDSQICIYTYDFQNPVKNMARSFFPPKLRVIFFSILMVLHFFAFWHYFDMTIKEQK